MSQAQGQRGRKVAAKKKNPLVPFYWAVAALVVLGAAFLITYTARGGLSPAPVTTVTGPVNRTAEGFWYKGNPDAPVKVIDYSDYQCPTCAFYVKNVAPLITRDYIDTGKVQFIYHEFPLQGHQHAVPAAEAARCAGDQGKFWEMHDMLFANQGQWATLSSVTNVFSGYAGQIGLDRGAFDACMSAGTHRADVTAAGEASIARGVTGTPTFDVNGQIVDYQSLAGAIDAALSAAGK